MRCVHCHKFFSGSYCPECWNRLAFGAPLKISNTMSDEKYTIVVINQENGLSATVQAIKTNGQWLAREVITEEVSEEGGHTSYLAQEISAKICEL